MLLHFSSIKKIRQSSSQKSSILNLSTSGKKLFKLSNGYTLRPKYSLNNNSMKQYYLEKTASKYNTNRFIKKNINHIYRVNGKCSQTVKLSVFETVSKQLQKQKEKQNITQSKNNNKNKKNNKQFNSKLNNKMEEYIQQMQISLEKKNTDIKQKIYLKQKIIEESNSNNKQNKQQFITLVKQLTNKIQIQNNFTIRQQIQNNKSNHCKQLQVYFNKILGNNINYQQSLLIVNTLNLKYIFVPLGLGLVSLKLMHSICPMLNGYSTTIFQCLFYCVIMHKQNFQQFYWLQCPVSHQHRHKLIDLIHKFRKNHCTTTQYHQKIWIIDSHGRTSFISSNTTSQEKGFNYDNISIQKQTPMKIIKLFAQQSNSKEINSRYHPQIFHL